MQNRPVRQFLEGKNYQNFEIIKVTEIAEIKATLIELCHMPSGASVLHIANDDAENLFCLSFQTLPQTSNGVAHILEHTVLCGSKKFPIKDPFFSMTRRSLNTFMNALTGQDFTCYPAASQVPKDFYNLLEVYIDAVFHPNLAECSFWQEGHRLEFENYLDATSNLEYKGIVFNEMKGALSTSMSRLYEAIGARLFPDVSYGVNSGGDPKEIPDLSYQELKNFHELYYHPSRCLFFFYGNMPLDKHLDFLEEHALAHVIKKDPLPLPKLQPRFTNRQTFTHFYPSEEEEVSNRCIISFSWLTCHISEQKTALALQILEIALLGTDASPLKKTILQTNLSTQVSSYLDSEIPEIPFSLILKGCRKEDVKKIETLIFCELKKIAQNGISLELIESAMHQLEFHSSEITGDHHPFGLSLFMRSALLKQHGQDPVLGLSMHQLFDEIALEVKKDSLYFANLVQKYLCDNPHAVTIVMEPDPTLAQKELEAEKLKLKQIKNALSEAEKNEIVKNAKKLADFQQKQDEEDISILPSVSVKDIPKTAKDYPLIVERVDELEIYHCNQFTNQINYTNLSFPIPQKALAEPFYLKLFSTIYTQMGAAGSTYEESLKAIQAHTGGISSYINLNTQTKSQNFIAPTFHLNGKALYRKTAQLYELISQFAGGINLTSTTRLKEIILKHYTILQSRLTPSSLKYAINLSASNLSYPAKLANELNGYNYFQKLEFLVENFDSQAEILTSKLAELQKLIIQSQTPHLLINCCADEYLNIKKNELNRLVSLVRGNKPQVVSFSDETIYTNVQSTEAVEISSPVAFIAKVLPTVPYEHEDAPALNLAAHLFDNLILHKEIREKGGAYGGGSSSNTLSGSFYFYSYRDPNISTTISAFEKAIQHIIVGNFDEEDLNAAKLETAQAWDSPISPGSKIDVAYSWLLSGKTVQLRQKFRRDSLSLAKKDIQDAVKRHLLPAFANSSTVIFAGKELIERESKDLKKIKLI